MKHYGIKIKSILTGILVVAAGILLLLFNNGVLPIEYKSVVFCWESLLIAIGFINLFSRHSWGFGVILMLIGGYFLLPKLNIPSLSFITQSGWAIILIIVGLLICFKAFSNHRFRPWSRCHGRFHKKIENHWGTQSSQWKHSYQRKNEPGYIERNFVFSGSKEKMNTQEFKGGEINCVFGGIELDLSDCQLAEGVYRLEINSVFGGVVLYVPIDWKIEIRQNHVLGNFADNRPKPEFEIFENKILILEANSVFGGGEIKCKNQ